MDRSSRPLETPSESQSRQVGIDAFQDVVGTEIKALRCSGRIARPANPAFRLKHNSIPEEWPYLQHPAENLFGPSTAVDIGMIEEIGADLLGSVEEFPGSPVVVCRQLGVRSPAASPMQPKAKRDTSRSVWGIFIVSIGLSFLTLRVYQA